MRKFRDTTTGEILFYEADGSQDEHIKQGLEEITDFEAKSALDAKINAIKNSPENILATRQGLLNASDWTQMADSPLTQTQKDAWAIYRQALRDITSQKGYPTNIVWPTKP